MRIHYSPTIRQNSAETPPQLANAIVSDWFIIQTSYMKTRYILFRRAGVYYSEDTTTRKQSSLRTKDQAEARALLHAKNESVRQPILNLQLARTYLTATDPEAVTRNWQVAMEELTKTKSGRTMERYQDAVKDKAFDLIRNVSLLETHSSHFLKVLEAGTVATNVFLRRIHNFALDMNWLPWPILSKKQWPEVRFKEKRAITAQEHQAILTGERKPEWRAYYEFCWHLGGAQSDVAHLSAEDIDWQSKAVGFYRRKTGTVSIIRFGAELEKILAGLPKSGPLFPAIQTMNESGRAAAFNRRCRQQGIEGVTLHCYRYAWAERAKTCGYPERFAQEALGHKSQAVHRAYARKAKVVIPTLEDYERKLAASESVVVPMPAAVA